MLPPDATHCAHLGGKLPSGALSNDSEIAGPGLGPFLPSARGVSLTSGVAGGSVAGAMASGLAGAGGSLGLAGGGFGLSFAFFAAVAIWSFTTGRAGLPLLPLAAVRPDTLLLAAFGLLSAGGVW